MRMNSRHRGKSDGSTICNGAQIDITDKRGAEEALLESENRWRHLAEAMPQLVWTCTPDGLCDYLSSQWVDYTGICEVRQLGYAWLEQVHPDDHEPLMAAWRNAVRTSDMFDVEFRIRRYDGTYRWFKTRAVPIRNDTGRIFKWYGSNTDINDLRESEARLRLQLERMPIACILHDASFRFIGWNPAAERIFGFTAAEAIGNNAVDLIIPPQGQSQVSDIFKRLQAGDLNASSINENITKDGRIIICEWTNTPILDENGTVTAVLSMAQDITERLEAEEKLRASEERMRLAMEIGGIGSFDRDMNQYGDHG